MTVSISTPNGVIYPNKPVTLYFTPSATDATWVRVWVHAAPAGSRLSTQIELHASRGLDPDTHVYYDRTRIKVFEGRSTDPWQTTFEKGGRYVLICQEYSRDEYAGGYEGAPQSALAETLIGPEVTKDLVVAQTTTQPVGVGNDTAMLTIVSLEDTILEATLTPSPRSQLASAACESDAVTAAVDALVGLDLTDVGTVGDWQTWSAAFFAGYNAHLTSSYMHPTDDTANAILNSYATQPTPKAFIDFVNVAIRLLRQHVTNDDGSGTDTASYHHGGDRAAIPVYTGVTTLAEAYAAAADLTSCFSAHQLNVDAHDSLIIHTVPTLSAIQRVHDAYLAIAHAPWTATPPAQQTGVQTLIAYAGFVEAPR